MVLRVWALYNRSKFILSVLLPLYAAGVIPYLAYTITLSARNEPIGM